MMVVGSEEEMRASSHIFSESGAGAEPGWMGTVSTRRVKFVCAVEGSVEGG